MSKTVVDKKRIVKNTLLLYIRMLFVMGVTLFTTRIVLKNLGVEDYGIFNVVGGIVTMFAFLNSAMTGATQRFISFEVGISNTDSLKKVFSQSVIIHILIAAVILLLAETIGLWFVYNKLNIPESRYIATLWVYQFSVFSFLINVIQVPYSASIIAHEKMNVYAWVSIIDVVLKLAVAYLISITAYDKLKVYSLLIFISIFIVNIFYWLYCRKKFLECRFKFVFERTKFVEMLSFAGWNMIGNLALALRTQGSNILLNLFFGPAVNAARGVAHQIDSATEQFVTNFQTASNPQIVKTYAVKAYDETLRLVCQCSRFSYYLILILSIPLLLQMDYVLNIWLSQVPPYTVIFSELILINGIIDSISKPLKTYIKATGKVKYYMIIQGGFFLLALPVIYIYLKLGYSPVSSIVILVLFTFLGTFLRLYLSKKVGEGFSISFFFKTVVCPISLVTILSALLCCLVNRILLPQTFIFFLIKSVVFMVMTISVIWFTGMNVAEKKYIISLVAKVKKRK